MHHLSLSVPKKEPVEHGSDHHPGAYLDWLERASLADFKRTTKTLLRHLTRDNQKTIGFEKRFKFLENTHPYFVELHALLKDKRRQSGPVFSKKHQKLAALEYGILSAMSVGYKSVLIDAQRLSSSGVRFSQLPVAVYRATQYLTWILVNRYANYQAEPTTAWRDIHHLYEFAKAQGFADSAFNSSTDQADPGNNVDHTYKKIILLALSNPYNLMASETESIFDMAHAWASELTLTPISSPTEISAQFLIDIEADRAPVYIPAGNTVFKHGYLIEISNLSQRIGDQIRVIEVEHRKKGTNTPLPYLKRIHRDLLVRTSIAWSGRRERKHNRKQSTGVITLGIGFNSTHHYLSNEQPFAPELDELNTHRIDSKGAGSGLSLLGKDQRVWTLDQTESSIKSGMDGSRLSSFDSESVSKDAWQQVYATQTNRKTVTQAHHLSDGEIINSSAGGLAVRLNSETELSAKVGELVAFRAKSNADNPLWTVGSISWMTMGETLEIGVKGISSKASAIACRAVEGTGAGSEYLRCLMTQTSSPEPRLLAPAAIYDIHTLLALNLGTKLIYARITKMIETTRTYSMFLIKAETIPESEVIKVNKLRGNL